jgi:hypothetical protein
VPGARHDKKALELTGWSQILETTTWIADAGYIDTNTMTPTKKRPGQKRSDPHKQYNKTISAIRSAVERCISHLKNWKIIKTGYRRQLKQLADTIRPIVRLTLFNQTSYTGSCE